MSARDRLAAQQAQLLDALLAGAEPPAGFDPAELAREADALRAKRRRVTGLLRADLPAALGDRFVPLFDRYAPAHPKPVTMRAREDADRFADWLVEQGELPRPPGRLRRLLRRTG